MEPTFEQQISEIAWAKEPVFTRLAAALGPFTPIEPFLRARLPLGASTFTKDSFIALLQSLNAGTQPEHVVALTNQLAFRDSGVIDPARFSRLYTYIMNPSAAGAGTETVPMGAPTQAPVPVPPKSAAGRGKDRVLEALAKHMSSRKLNGIADLLKVTEDRGMRVVGVLEFRVALDKLQAAELSYEDKESFMAEFRARGNDKMLNVDVIETALFSFLRKANETKIGMDEMMEEVRKAAMGSFADVIELFRGEDVRGTGYVDERQFDLALKRIKVGLGSEQVSQLFAMALKLQEHTAPGLSYQNFVTQLEQCSLRRVNIPPGNPNLAVIQQIRAYIKEHATNTLRLVFQPTVGRNFDNKRYLSLKDFHDCLAKLDIVLPTPRFNELTAFLDPSRASQVDFDYFCEVLGYVQPSEVSIQRPTTGGDGNMRRKEEAKSRMPESVGFRRPPAGGKKRELNAILADLHRVTMQRGTNLMMAFQQSDARREMCVSKQDFERVLGVAPSQVSVVEDEFGSNVRFGAIDYMRFCKALESAGTAVRAMCEKVFPGFQRKMSEQGTPSLPTFLARWDPKGEHRFSQPQFLDLVVESCGRQFLLEPEVSAIAERYGEAGALDFGLMEADFTAVFSTAKRDSATSQEPPKPAGVVEAPGPDVLGRMYAAMKRFCEHFKIDPGAVFGKYKVVNGYMSADDFLKAAGEMCRNELTEREVAGATERLKERGNMVQVQTVLAQYASTLVAAERRPVTGHEAATEEKRRVLGAIAEKATELSVDLESLFVKNDSARSRTLPKAGLVQLLVRYLNVGGELVTALGNVLAEYDTSNSGFVQYDYLLNDVKQELGDRKRMVQYFSELKRYLFGRGIRLLDSFRREDARNDHHLPKNVIAEIIARTSYQSDPATLASVLASLSASPDGRADYIEFENRLQNAPEIVETQYAPGTRPTDTKQMLSDIAEAVRAGGFNMGDTFAEQDYSRSGAVPMSTFLAILQTLKMQRYDASDIAVLGKTYEDPRTGGVQYKPFLAQVEQFMATKTVKHAKANLQWANKIFDDIALALFRKKDTCLAHFRNHGLNTLNDTIRYPGFEEGMKTLGVKVSEREMQQLARELDTLYDGSVSIRELQTNVEERGPAAVQRCWDEVSRRVADCAKAKGINLQTMFRKHDSYNTKEIASADFDYELQLLLGSVLEQEQYKFLVTRYESRAGRVAYTKFVQDVLGQKEAAPYLADPRKVQLIDKLRDCVRTRQIKLVSRLLENGPGEAGHYPSTLLMSIFPRDVLSNDEYEMLASVVDERRTGKFQVESICDLLWTGKDEEEFRVNGTANAEGLNSKVRSFCRNKRVDLEGELMKLDRDFSGYLSSDDIKSVFYGVGMTFSFRQLAALLYYQNVGTDGQWRKSYIDLAMRIFGQTSIPERLGKRPQTTNPMAPPFAAGVFEERKHPREEYRGPPVTPAQETLLTRLYQEVSKTGANMMEQFKAADPSEMLYISRVSFLDTFARLRISLAPEDVKTIVGLPKVTEPPDDTIIHYAEFLNLMSQVGGHVPPIPMDMGESTFRPYTAASVIGARPEEARFPAPEPQVPEVHPHEMVLDEECMKYVVKEFDVLREYLQKNGTDVRREFGRYERDGYIEFARFCQVLASLNVELREPGVLDAFYSYLKEDKENVISANRLYDALIFGKRLTQYPMRPQPAATSIMQREQTVPSAPVAVPIGVQVKRLAEFVARNKINTNMFRTHALGGRVLRREHLAASLQEIKYEYSPAELDAIFKTIDVKMDGNGSLPHLLTILAEQSAQQEQRKIQFDAAIQETISMINKDLLERKISVEQLHKSLDVNGDGYVDRAEFVSGMTRIGVRAPPGRLAAIFTVLDVNQYEYLHRGFGRTGALSVNSVALYICGAKKSTDERLKSMSIDAQIELEIDELFKRLDEDKNGMLTEDELFKAVSASSHNGCSRAEVKEIMRALDTDNSNYIDREEFRVFMLNQIKKDIISAEDEMEDLRAKFLDYDLDGNGWLSQAEI